MTVSELIAWCNAIYEPDESSDYEISDSKWMLFFNEAINQIRPHTQVSVTATADKVNGTEEYAIPEDCDVLYDLYEISSSDGTIYSEMVRMPIETILGLCEYTLWDRTLKIAAPTEDITEGLKLYYYKKLSDFTATTDEIELDDPYIIGYYALSRVELSDRQNTEFTIHYSEYETRLKQLKSKIGFDEVQFEDGSGGYGYVNSRQF